MNQWLSWLSVGWLVGIAQLIPGVSGSTVAVVLNRYQPFIQAVNAVVDSPFRFRLAHGIVGVTVMGAGASLVINAGVMAWLLDQYSVGVYGVFLVLILLSVPVLYRKWTGYRMPHLMGSAVCGFLLGWLMTVVCPPSSDAVTQLSVVDSVLSGFVAMGTMVVPGISGSMMLVFMGTYDAIVLAVAQLNMRALMLVSLGAVLGGLVMVKLVDFVLERFPLLSYCVIMSLVLASVPVLWVHIIVS